MLSLKPITNLFFLMLIYSSITIFFSVSYVAATILEKASSLLGIFLDVKGRLQTAMDRTSLKLKIDDVPEIKTFKKRRTKSENLLRSDSIDSGYDDRVIFRIGD